MDRYEVILSHVVYERVLVVAAGKLDAAQKAVDDWCEGNPGEVVMKAGLKAEWARLLDWPGLNVLPRVEIRGEWYVRDDRLRQYRSMKDPNETIAFGDV